MLPFTNNYAVYPSVFPAGVSTDVTIVPTEPAFLFRENEEYRIVICDVNGDEIEYYAPTVPQTVTVKAHEGVLRFSYTFSDEQEHKIDLFWGEKALGTLVVYSLYEDLYALRPYRGDFHAHSYRSDGAKDPASLAGQFREQGYDLFALTDHNRYYPSNEAKKPYEGVRLGLHIMNGEEIHTPGSMLHIVHVGGRESVTEQYFRDREGYEKAVDEYLPFVPPHVPEQYRRRYAMANWACDRIHEADGLAILAHPYWRPRGSYNLTEEFARILLTSGMFDAYEIVGGNGRFGINMSVALLTELAAEGFRIPLLGSSDVHKTEKSNDFPHRFTICFATANDRDGIMNAVRTGKTVAVEAEGYEYSRTYRCYGEMRLVSYAHYLLNHYFPALQRMCQGEGIAMSAFVMGSVPASLIELQREQSDLLRGRFFGDAAPVIPSAELLAYEDEARRIHLEGPLTKGSHLDMPTVTRQI